jgi:hypothetical protein
MVKYATLEQVMPGEFRNIGWQQRKEAKYQSVDKPFCLAVLIVDLQFSYHPGRT